MKPIDPEDIKIIKRIRKLVAMAEDQADRPEGALARKRADKLMEKHQLTDEDVQMEKRPIGQVDLEWKLDLAAALSLYLDCQIDEVEGEGQEMMHVWDGLPHQLARADYLHTLLITEISEECEDVHAYWGAFSPHVQEEAWHRSFATWVVIGFTERVVEGCADEEEFDKDLFDAARRAVEQADGGDDAKPEAAEAEIPDDLRAQLKATVQDHVELPQMVIEFALRYGRNIRLVDGLHDDSVPLMAIEQRSS